jgi:hypothetical protein
MIAPVECGIQQTCRRISRIMDVCCHIFVPQKYLLQITLSKYQVDRLYSNSSLIQNLSLRGDPHYRETQIK